MKISIVGLGYVGAVSAGCLASDGHEVVGVDLNDAKVECINQGRAPIIEMGLDDLIAGAVAEGRLRATNNLDEAIKATDLTFVCVGTPSQINGNLDLQFVRRVSEEIGEALKNKKGYHVVVVRSTMLPGSMQHTVIAALENVSGLVVGRDFGACLNPEFLREGSAVADYYNPPKIVIGESDEDSGNILAKLYGAIDAPMVHTDIASAEMVKYCDNVWHALKVCFANEVGDICKELGLDSHKIMDIFCKDTKLNLSKYYMKPGFAFGGSCLPKDVRALTYKAKTLDLVLPVLNAICHSNERQVERGLKMITSKGNKKVGVLGISFKAGTDDLRESPIVEVVERLIGKGYDLRLYDSNVKLASIHGANKNYILNHIPHISSLMANSIEEVIEHSETLLIGNDDKDFATALKDLRSDQVVVDFVRLRNNQDNHGNYDGICW